jgi:GT2 family glycosyltransferase
MIYFLTVNYYSTHLLTKLVSSLPDSQNIDYTLVIVNNSPQDNSVNQLQGESIFIMNAEDNLGFGRACNLGIQWIYTQDTQAIIWIINPDAYLLDNNLDKLNLFFQSYPNISILGTIIYTSTNEVWFAGGIFKPRIGAILNQDLLKDPDTAYTPCDWVSGCSLIINLCKFPTCPAFDPAYFLYYEDVDFCRRYANQGHLVAVTKNFRVVHQPSSITNRNISLKIKHSTYGYLLTLEKYTNKDIQILRLTRLISYALILIAIKPQVAFGKISGVLIYWRRHLKQGVNESNHS